MSRWAVFAWVFLPTVANGPFAQCPGDRVLTSLKCSHRKLSFVPLPSLSLCIRLLSAGLIFKQEEWTLNLLC